MFDHSRFKVALPNAVENAHPAPRFCNSDGLGRV
jgi:hypothetical protein